ncbi:unnamed protein product, partial [Ixodes hexagonus]
RQAFPWYGSSTKEEGPQSSQGAPDGCLGRLKRDAWLFPLVYCEFWISAAFSLFQPFYPVLASSKGLDAWKYGFVFSALKFSMFLGSLFGDRFMAATSPVTCYLVGQGGFFLFTVAFGCLYWAPGGNVLLGLSIALVTLGGFTNTLYLVSMFAVFTTRFRKSTGYIVALLEFLWGSGNMVGSAIGGALIDVWAFPLPFFVLGATTILFFPVILKMGSRLNNVGGGPPSDDAGNEADLNYSKFYLDLEFLAAMISLMLSWVMLGFNEPTLEPSLRDFNLTSTEIGEVFTVQFGSYAVGGLLAGTMCAFDGEAFYLFLGDMFAVLAFLMVGPAPFIHVKRELWMVYLSQVFTGLGMSALFICGYSRALKLVVLRGYPYNIRSNGFVSSSIFTFAVFGAMVTPPIAGYLVEMFGYRIATMAMFGLLLAWLPATFALWIKSLCSPDRARLVNENE